MRKSRFTEKKIIGIHEQAEAGMTDGSAPVPQHGMPDAMCYKRRKCGRMGVFEVRRLRGLKRRTSTRSGSWPSSPSTPGFKKVIEKSG